MDFFNQNQFLEDLNFQQRRSAVWSSRFVPVSSRSRWIFMLLLFFNDLRNRDSTNPSEGSQRDIFKNMLKYSERVGRGNEQQGERERWKEDKHRQNSPCMYKRFYISLLSIIHRQERLCEIFTMKSRQQEWRFSVSEKETQPPSGPMLHNQLFLIITCPVKHILPEMMDWYDMQKSLHRFLEKKK